MEKFLLLVTVSALGILGFMADNAVANSKGCITVQGITVCGSDIPDNPTIVCSGDACDSGANADPPTPPDTPGSVTDDNNDPDAQLPPTATTITTTPVVVPPTARPPSYCEVTPTADIGVINTAGASSYGLGSMVNYTLDVFNSGSPECNATDVSLNDSLPPQMELLSAEQVTTTQGACSVVGGVGNQTISCSFSTLSAGQHVMVSIVARADSPGTLTNRACVGTTTVSDPNVVDNQCSSATIAISNTATSPNNSHSHRLTQARGTVKAQGLLWDGRTFRSTDEFAGWLSARGASWERFIANHPSAAAGLIDRG